MKFIFLLSMLFYVCNANTIILDNSNYIDIKGEINPKSSSDFIMEINRIHSNQIVIYIQSPGGYVESGKEIINEINIQLQNGKDISCIAERAYSMAFIIFQSCPVRYITNNTVLMQHPIYISQLSGNLKTVENILKMIDKDNEDLLEIQCNKIKIDKKEFEILVSNELWLMGNDNINMNTADEIISVSCSKELYNIETQEIIFNPFIGEIITTKIKCPLIKYGKKEINNSYNQTNYSGINYKYLGDTY